MEAIGWIAVKPQMGGGVSLRDTMEQCPRGLGGMKTTPIA